MKKTLTWFCLLIALSFSAVAQDFIVTTRDFDLRMPSGWSEIPKEVLIQSQEAASKSVGEELQYDYGYQSPKYENWFDLPYVLVQINRSGRVSESKLKTFDMNEGFKGVKKMEEKGALSNSSTEAPTYDPKTQTLWLTLSADFPGKGKVKTLAALILTEYGYIQFNGYVSENNFADFEPIFKKIIESIKLGKDAYKPSITNTSPTLFGISFTRTYIPKIVGLLIAGFVIFLFKKYGKKQPNIRI